MKKNAHIGISYREMSATSLSNYILDIQHPYMKKSLAAFLLCTKTISKECSKSTPAMADILSKLETLIQQHLEYEEELLLPFLSNYSYNRSHSVKLPVPLKEIKSQHEKINSLFEELREISNDYTPPSESAPSIKLCYAQLFNFEQDMLKHTILEEDILFPKLLQDKLNL